MAFRWRTNDGLTLNSGLVALRFFRGTGPVLLRKPFSVIFQGVSVPPVVPPPLWIRPCQSRNFQPCRYVSLVEPVLNRVYRVLHKKTIWCLQRDSNQRPFYLKSSTLLLVDSTRIIQLFGLQVLYSYLVTVSPRGMRCPGLI